MVVVVSVFGAASFPALREWFFFSLPLGKRRALAPFPRVLLLFCPKKRALLGREDSLEALRAREGASCDRGRRAREWDAMSSVGFFSFPFACQRATERQRREAAPLLSQTGASKPPFACAGSRSECVRVPGAREARRTTRARPCRARDKYRAPSSSPWLDLPCEVAHGKREQARPLSIFLCPPLRGPGTPLFCCALDQHVLFWTRCSERHGDLRERGALLRARATRDLRVQWKATTTD